jgi:hypothetical protein
MRQLAKPMVVACLFAWGCAKPNTEGDPQGGGGATGQAGSTASGSGQGGSPTSSGKGGTTSGSGSGGQVTSTGAGGSAAPACTPDPTQLINTGAWNCDLNESIMIQGAVYGYGDGSSCGTPIPKNICTGGNGCCLSGTTVVDTTYAKWGCGIGMELASSGGNSPTKSVYAGPVKCFNITLTGNSGNNVVRISFTQSAMPAADAVAPFTEIPAFTSGWSGQVCFADVSCPSWAMDKCMKTGTDGTPVDMQIQISAGSTATTTGTYNVCVSSIVPVTSGGGTGGSSGTASCAQPSGTGSLTTQYADAHVGCPKDYIVQNNAWGSTAGQTVTYGPGTKMKVTVQNGTGANGSPASYPSIFTGAYNNRSTASSGLPRAVSQITATGVNTSWTWSDTAVNAGSSSYNAAYDVWFSTGSGGDPTANAPSGGYLMVWYYKPSDNQPIGMTIPNGSVTINGKQFNIWYGMNGSKPVVSYVAQQKMSSWSFPLGAFINDAATRNCSGSTKCINPSWYLTAVFGGFEIWKGGVNLETTDFGVTVP